MPLLALLTLTFAALLAGAVVGVLLNRAAFERRLDAQVAELFAEIETLPTYYSDADVAELPEPARRFFGRNLHDGMPHQSCVRIWEAGKLRQTPGQPWSEFEAEQYMVSTPPGMLWYARMRPFPLVWVDLVNSYFRGRGRVQAKLLSSVSSVDAGDDATRRATLLRYVSGLALFPGAMLPADDRGWTEHGEDSATFTLRDGELEVTGVFFFDEFGDVVRFETDERPYAGMKKAEQARWIVRYAEHRSFGSGGDLQLPTKIDVEWELDGQRFHYVEKTIEKFDLDMPRRWNAVIPEGSEPT
ncbi:hypothetical protein ENSA5_12710 [Enhygromyxa salina]|uniref:Uncharacterized protein n=1 Tax=Enhygromyxa salina TaxID=215803 RepID=A0A2S9YFB1_9BACT|nr:DUF6544 family protein [Enhygromyxa salina]PRQ03722.1 hypothetical protein ENSA5_12710 [Enhygromyxa salina]